MGQLVFQATLGGQVNLVGPNTASTFNLNVPAVAGTLVTTGDTGTVTNTMLAGSIANAKLTNSSVTVGSTSIALGATSTTLDGVNIGATTAGTGAFTTLSGSTSVTTPIVKSASSLTLQSNGTTTAVTIDTSQNSTFAGTATATKLIPTGSSATGNGMFLPSANTLGFSTNGSERITITSGGATQIKPSAGATPTYSYTNDGESLLFRYNDDGGVRAADIVAIGNTPAGAGINMRFWVNSGSGAGTATERMRISSAGIVTMSAYGAGAATFSAAGVISSVSDETWKIKDGVPVDTDSMLNKLNPGYWYYNNEKKETFGSDRQLGFYAQNVNAAIGPEAAPIPEEGKPWGYYDRSVLAITVMSLQKALATINTQASTINALTARIVALEAK